tara:strand:- start:5461 stop:6480 length:1020 start_codon:yes stop_codon:yes gene_type:complete
MASIYGYSQALSEGHSYNARIQAHNDLVNEHNTKVLADYDTAVKEQKRNKADDKSKEDEDAAIDATEDGKGLAMAGYGAFKLGQEAAEKGLGSALLEQGAGRMGAIRDTLGKLKSGDFRQVANKGVEASSEVTAAGEAAANTAQEASETAAQVTADAAKTGAGAAEEIGSSGIGSQVIKGVLGKVGVGKVVGEAGLSTLSELGGKAAGDFGGLYDLGKGFVNLGENKSFFGNDDTAEKWGDSLQMAGAAMDVVGTVFPPLELLGGITGLLGGVVDTVDSLSKDEDKKQSDAAPITDPNSDPDGAGIQKLQVSPAFQSMGLVASTPISAKMSITGSSGSF